LRRFAVVAAEHRSLVNYSAFTTSDSEEIAQLLGEVFAQREPAAVAAGIGPLEFEALVRLYCPKAEAEGLTIVARSKETGEMIGALLTEDSASQPPQGTDHLSPKFDPIFDILSELNAAYRGGKAPSAGESAHLFLLGVSQRFSGHGVAQQLVARTVANAQRKRYKVAVAEAMNRTSQHIFRKQGFGERGQLSYRDHRFHGQAVFAAIAEHGGPTLMDKLLRP
jgi:hypothetical protein